MRIPLTTLFVSVFFTISNAQTFTFACMDSSRLTGINCDVCPVTNITSRSFCGLLIYRDSIPYKWIDQPYTARLRPGSAVEYLEQIPSIPGVQTQDKITIALAQTPFFTAQGMIDSTVCHCGSGASIDTTPLFYASDSLGFAPIYRGDTLTIVGRGIMSVDFDSLLQKYIVTADTTGLGGGSSVGLDTLVAIPPAAGFTIAGSPAQNSRDTLTFTLANDLAALEALSGTGIIARTAAESYALRTITAGTGSITVDNGDGVGGSPTINNTDPDQSTTNEVQTYSHGFAGGTYTNTLSLGGGSWSIVGAGIAAITQTAGAVTVTATELDGSITNEAWTIDADDADTELITTQMVKFQGSGGITTNWVPGTDILEINNTAGTFYQLFRDDGLDKTARPIANFVSSATVAFTLTDDAGNTETEVSAIVPNDAITATQIATGAVGTSEIATGGVATVDIADQSVTYVKMQNAADDNVLLGNNNGAGTSFEELNAAACQTILGYIDGNMGAGGRIVYSSDANTVAAEAAFLYSAANDRMTITCDAPSFGAGAAILNLTNVGTDDNGEFLQMRGSITNLLTATMQNTSTAATSGVVFNISQSGNSAGDSYIQTQISGAGGHTTSFGMDNSDANKFKISPNANTPGANADKSLVATQDAIPLWGINKDAPAHALDVGGRVRSVEYLGLSTDEPTVGTLGNGLGTGAVINDVTGTNNGFSITFTAGSSGLVAGGDMFTVTYSDAYPGFSIPVFSQANDAAAGELTKFSFAAIGGASFTMKVAAGQTLTAGSQYILNFAVNGF